MGFGRYLDGCGNCMKYSLFFVNLLIFIGGLAVAGLGIYMVVDRSYGVKLLGSNLYIGAIYILIGASILLALIACFGCFGAVQEVRCMLLTYFIILFLIFVTMLVGGILLYVFRDQVTSAARKEMEHSIRAYNHSSPDQKMWDSMHKFFDCCGFDGPDDWTRSEWTGYPSSCCKPPQPATIVTHCSRSSPELRHEGCSKGWINFIKHNAAIMGGVGIGVACLMIVGMIFSCALYNMID